MARATDLVLLCLICVIQRLTYIDAYLRVESYRTGSILRSIGRKIRLKAEASSVPSSTPAIVSNPTYKEDFLYDPKKIRNFSIIAHIGSFIPFISTVI